MTKFVQKSCRLNAFKCGTMNELKFKIFFFLRNQYTNSIIRYSSEVNAIVIIFVYIFFSSSQNMTEVLGIPINSHNNKSKFQPKSIYVLRSLFVVLTIDNSAFEWLFTLWIIPLYFGEHIKYRKQYFTGIEKSKYQEDYYRITMDVFHRTWNQ